MRELQLGQGKGIESINSEIYSYSKQSIEDAVTATKAVLTCPPS